MNGLIVEPWALITAAVTIVGGMVVAVNKLSIWLVTRSEKRQTEITDRHIEFIEKALQNAQLDRKAFVDSMKDLSHSIRSSGESHAKATMELGDKIEAQSNEIKNLAQVVKEAISEDPTNLTRRRARG